MPILATVFSTPDELVDSAPEVSEDPEDPDDELEDVIPSSIGPVH